MQILIGGVDYSAHYKPQSMSIQDATGSTGGSASFVLETPAQFPGEEQEIIVWDSASQRVKQFAGRIKRVQKYAIGANPAIGYACQVQAQTYTRDIMRRPPVSLYYASKITSFIFRDIASRLPSGFDLSGIMTGGRTLDYFETRHEKLTAAFDRLAQAEGIYWWVDYDKKIHFDTAGVVAPFSLTEDNWAFIAGLGLKVEPDTTNLANQIQLFFTAKYADGTANVFNASTNVTGTGTQWLSKIQAGASFEVQDGSNASYTVERVDTDTSLYLTSNYAGNAASGASYQITGIPAGTVASDNSSIAAMAAITGDDGIYTEIVDSPGVDLTWQEARDFLAGELAQKSNPAVNITVPTTSYQVPGLVQAGMLVSVALPNSFGVNTTLQIRSLTKKDTGTQDANGYPAWAYTINFQTKLYDLAAILRQQHQDASQYAQQDTTFVDTILSVNEIVPLNETVSGIITPIAVSESVPLTETSVSVTEQPYWKPYVWGPSVRSFASQSDWQSGTLVNLDATTTPGTLQLASGQTSGTWTSPWDIQYSPNAGKTDTLTDTIPAGCSVVVQFRSAHATDGTGASAWYTNPASVPDNKYFQSQLLFTGSGGSTPQVTGLSYTPHKSVLRWSRTSWMGSLYTADYTTWTLTNVDAYPAQHGPLTTDTGAQLTTDTGATLDAEADSILFIAVGQTSGQAVSPWLPNTTRTVAKIAALTTALPAGASVLLEFRTGPDKSDAAASAWNTDIKATPDNPWIQYRVTPTGTGGAYPVGPEARLMTVSPT